MTVELNTYPLLSPLYSHVIHEASGLSERLLCLKHVFESGRTPCPALNFHVCGWLTFIELLCVPGTVLGTGGRLRNVLLPSGYHPAIGWGWGQLGEETPGGSRAGAGSPTQHVLLLCSWEVWGW